MLRVYIPAGVAVLAIVSLTAWEATLSDRFTSSSMTAEEFGKRFKNVPYVVGDWEGKDMTPDKATLEQAGAVNHVSRRYVNKETGQQVDLWLIVGHAREICRHTPDICYPSQGFSQLGVKIPHKIVPSGDDEHPAKFFTSKFRNESALATRTERVFWAWNGNEPGQDEWDAPEAKSIWNWMPFLKSAGPKAYYGNNTALYKMYFTGAMVDDNEPVAKNVAVDFAELMLPEINRALFPERYKDEPAASDADAAATAEEPAPAAEPAAAPATEPAAAEAATP